MSTIQPIHSLVYQCTISKVQQIYPNTVSSSLQQEFITAQEVYIHLISSSKTQLAFLIASDYYVHLWLDVQYLYTAIETTRSL